MPTAAEFEVEMEDAMQSKPGKNDPTPGREDRRTDSDDPQRARSSADGAKPNRAESRVNEKLSEVAWSSAADLRPEHMISGKGGVRPTRERWQTGEMVLMVAKFGAGAMAVNCTTPQVDERRPAREVLRKKRVEPVLV